MNIGELAPLAVAVMSEIAVVIPLFGAVIGNRKAIVKRLDEMERTMQMLVMHDDHLPMSERLNGGKRYVDLGGNGAQTAYYQKLEEKYKERVGQDMGGKQ